ncbi:MAG: restriction endonuclease subunit S [Candidatus Scalindua sp.]|jgi:type I restriction enzyme S subunit|nr:restriction endonuclease subunit S [Candidatus Scalindua sp.]MBT5304683.1 restriction endonuclease subunit S [Candidatus Scalindua sp.]MBT6046810.1 restriction endonuclease subunit S [Candidatus Scalindua sp.]MBT6226318.1 restriction endonuclease subunit S [Candidatus Scalindua sp.]MBT6564686.1 restriction endonuclease subunit S [Candidatus Scalindua sp.]
MKLKPYLEYKDSGVPWLRKIPKGWEIYRGKWLFKKADRPIREEDDVVTCFRDGIVTLRKKRRTTGFTESLKEIGYQGIRKGDLVIHQMDAFAGAIGVSDSDGKATPVYSVCLPKEQKLNTMYYAHIVREMARSEYILSLTKGIRERSTDFRFDTFANQYLPTPKRDEQNQIARFLDCKASQIASFIRAKKRMIELLKEQKQAIINQAVTRGINPEVKMNPGEVDWLGDIPEHWDIVPLKSLGRFQNGISESADYFGSGYPFISYGDVYSNMSLPLKVEGLARSSDKERRRLSVQEGDVFFTRTSETIEEIGISSVCLESIKDAIFSGFIIRFRPTKKILTKEYSKYYFRSFISREFFVKEMNIVTRASLAQGLLKRFPVLLPPASEQKEIFDFLEITSMRIDLAIEKAQHQIDLLQQYRTRLISDVVTGKVDVRSIKVEDVTDEELLENMPDTEEIPACAEASAGRKEVEDDVEKICNE